MTLVTCLINAIEINSLITRVFLPKYQIKGKNNMQITRQADYCLRAMLFLSKLEPNQRASTSQIAEETAYSASFLAKIISLILSIAGLIHTTRGARGGYP
jgi:hypothetical protein